MTATTKPESNLARDVREMAEAQARLRAERDKNPQLAAMSKALEHTKAEREQLADAERRRDEAEAAVNAAGVALNRAQRGMAPVKDESSKGFGFFLKAPSTYRAASASLPALRADVEEAGAVQQSAIRRYQDIVAAINRARFERRSAAKARLAPKPTKPTNRGDRWQSAGAP